MLNTLTVSFFGHRYIDNVFEIEYKVEGLLNDLMRNNEYVEILVGRNGEFDLLVAAIANKLKKRNKRENLSIVWVQPYPQAEYIKNADSFDEYYDSVEICEESLKGHFKSAIQTRNRRMIERSDLVVCYVREKGGAYLSRQYAETTGKRIIDI